MNLYRLLAALASGINRDLPITAALVFARIGTGGAAGVLQATVQRELGLSPAVTTRTVQALSELDLVTRNIDRGDGRHRVLMLTGKGGGLLNQLGQ